MSDIFHTQEQLAADLGAAGLNRPQCEHCLSCYAQQQVGQILSTLRAQRHRQRLRLHELQLRLDRLDYLIHRLEQEDF